MKKAAAAILLIVMLFSVAWAEGEQRFNYQVIRYSESIAIVSIRPKLLYMEDGELTYSAVHAEEMKFWSVEKGDTPNGLLFKLDTTQPSAAICVMQVDKSGKCLGTLHLLFSMQNGEIQVEAVES